jgi:hypothetical protein
MNGHLDQAWEEHGIRHKACETPFTVPFVTVMLTGRMQIVCRRPKLPAAQKLSLCGRIRKEICAVLTHRATPASS